MRRFFAFFSFPLLKGEPDEVLKDPGSAVISETLAKKIFKNEDPVGKIMTYGINEDQYLVKGVFKDVPENSNLKFDLLLSIHEELRNEKYRDNWRSSFNFKTYVLLSPKADVENLNKKMVSFYENHLGQKSEKIFHLQPLDRIHLYSDDLWEPEVKAGERGDVKSMYFLVVIAVLILAIAWVNYVNLSTARAIDRSREVGLRKVIGATRRQLINQFLLESFMFNLLGVVIAIILMFLFLPVFNRLFGFNLSFSYLISERIFWIPVALLFLLGIFFSGFYTSFVLSSFSPLTALKGEVRNDSKGVGLRKVLVIFQFSICVILIASALCTYLQLNFMYREKLGINIDNVMLVSNPTYLKFDEVVDHGKSFVNELEKHPEIKNITLSNYPGQPYFASDINMRRQNSSEKHEVKIAYIDSSFLTTYEIGLVAGRGFSAEFPSDSGSSMLVNEAAAKLFGFENPDDAIGQNLIGTRGQKTIVGVIKDYHQQYVKKAIDPVCFIIHRYSPHQFYSIKLSRNSAKQSIELIRENYNKFFPGYPMDYMFLKDLYGRQYVFEQQFGKMCTLLSLIAVILACLGLFALSSYTIKQRTKEMGIRKIYGARTKEILFLLSRDFLKLVFFAAILAFPLAFWGLNRWLEAFATRIHLGWWFFIIPISIILPIILATVAYNVYKVATDNPIKALRAQ